MSGKKVNGTGTEVREAMKQVATFIKATSSESVLYRRKGLTRKSTLSE